MKLIFNKIQQFQITEGAAALKTYNDTTPNSGGVGHRSFCGNCGSPIKIENAAYAMGVTIPYGVLDWEENDGWKPDREVFCKRRVAWLDEAGAAKESRFSTMT